MAYEPTDLRHRCSRTDPHGQHLVAGASQHCPGIQDDLEQLRTEVTQLQQANDAALAALEAGGVGIAPNFVPNNRLQALIDHLLGQLDGENTPRARLEYELVVQRRFEKAIAQIEAEIRKRKLVSGIDMSAIRSNGRHPGAN